MSYISPLLDMQSTAKLNMSQSVTPAESGKHLTNGESREVPKSPARPKARQRQRSSAVDVYDSILWRLRPQWPASTETTSLLGVIGAGDGVGTSTVAANIARRLVEHADGPVVLVDANLYRPRAHRLLRGKKNPGLAEVLTGNLELGDAVQNTHTPGLDLLSSGKAGMLNQVSFPLEAVDSLRSELLERYAAVVFDLPTATDLGPSLLLAQRLDEVMLVVQADRTRRAEAERAAKRLKMDGVAVTGALLNRQKDYAPSWLRCWF